MNNAARRLFDEALALPDEERESLALALLESTLRPDDAEQVDAAWRAEVVARLERLRAGRVEASSWESAEARLRQRLRQP